MACEGGEDARAGRAREGTKRMSVECARCFYGSFRKRAQWQMMVGESRAVAVVVVVGYPSIPFLLDQPGVLLLPHEPVDVLLVLLGQPSDDDYHDPFFPLAFLSCT